MTAAPILNELRRHGVSVRREGGRLKLTAATVIPADVIELARAHKPELLAALPDPTEQRHRLLAAARELGIPRLVIAELPDAEIDGCQWLDEPSLRRYAQICLENWLVARGVLILHPTNPARDLERYRITHPTGTPR